jgi:kinesin family member 18A
MSSIKIALRVRPEHKGERADKRHRIVVKTINEKMLLFDPENEDAAASIIPDNYNKPKDKKFAFDVVLDQFTTQRQV